MKKLCTLILLATVHFSFAQDPLLFNNTWHLLFVTANDVTHYPPNPNMYMNFDSPTSLHTNACNTMTGQVVFENNYTNFSASNYSYSLDMCFDTAAENFQNIYFPFFDSSTGTSPATQQNFTYSIVFLGETVTLFINSEFNQQAVYGSEPLSTPPFNKESFSIYPNPSEDFIKIKLNNSPSKKTTLDIYNNIGILQKSEQLTDSTTQINISNLAAGVYFLKITSETGTSVKKLTKK
jgi:hypothetical protein